MTQEKGPFQLPPLPWAENALEPVVSARTIGLHYGKHHRTYVTKLNELVAGTRFADLPLERVILESAGKEQKIFNNAAQTWNHTFFWNCLRAPKGGARPAGQLAERIERDLGGYDKFREDFANAAVNTFGSGWAWVADRGGKLEIMSTSNADLPMTKGATAILTIDVWEHAYYVDYENRRPEFVKAVIEQLLNWEFAAEQLARAEAQQKAA
jgi:superoxide dismutase, Fe-Mn family